MSKSCFDENLNENRQENILQDENSENSQVENPQTENSQESVQKKSSGRPPAGIWAFFNKGASVKGHCSGQCKECGSFWARAKPVDLEEHLALDCLKQNQDVIEFYTQIIANRQGNSQAAPQEIIPGVEPSKKKHKLAGDQATLSEFLESTKLTPQRECNINTALIKAFIV
ncbi:zinc finger bed domain-containing protein 1-like [Gigaspora margarita]|uniref:Zinc finger bed domain-containing protein 1-like n=1 Tax=Gigaspora margarita TaxID=4874 RepID=A0A8H4ELG4_GIGMA|nr:zinc finger bed domain-containing protein 1-like [Gigaspora margarita]